MDYQRKKKLENRLLRLEQKFKEASCNKEAEKYLASINKIKQELKSWMSV